jgi:predicted choloylglycine hydrolase
MEFDLLREVKAIVRDRGLDPQEYRQTLMEASIKRWGNSSILRKGGIGIDEVYDEFKAYYPWMFDSLDDFVEALVDRLYRTKTDEVDPETVQFEEYYTTIEGQDVILLMLQSGSSERTLKREYTRKALDTLEEDGLVKKEKRRFSLSSSGIRRILQRCLEVMRND